MTEASNRPPQQGGSWRAIALALLMHMALVAFLWVGVRWQNETPLVVEAEIWDPKVREAAPLPEPETPPPAVPAIAPEPVVIPTPPPPKIEEAIVVNPDIALEKKRKEQALEKQRLLEKERQLEKELEKEQERIKARDKQLAAEQAQASAAAKREEAKKAAEKEANKEANKEASKVAEKLAEKLADDKRRAQADNKASEQRRQDDLKRMMSQAAGNGDAAKSQGPRGNPAYAGKVGARIKSNTIFDAPSDLIGNPAVEYMIELLPDGSLRSMRKLTSSNVAGFDEAVARAIEKSQPFPKDSDGKVPSSFTVSHKPKDQ